MCVVHDYLTQRGGAERVVLAIMRAFPRATLVTSVYQPATTFAEFAAYDVRTTWLQRIPFARRDPRLALPVLAKAFSDYELPDCDVVICSSSGWAHGIRSRAPKIVYCHNPPRWLHQTSEYAAQQPLAVRVALEVMRTRLTAWDREAARSATMYLANSTTVQDRIRRTYGREAEVVPPPMAIDVNGPQDPIRDLAPGFLLTVSRTRGYKNTAALAEAVVGLPDERLVAVGGLPERAGMRDWPARLVGVADVSDARLRWLYANCSGLVAVSHEDFGLTPIEANAFAKPVACLRAGGYLDTLDPGVSGVFVESLRSADIADGIRRLRESRFDPAAILRHAERFALPAFAARLRHQVARLAARDVLIDASSVRRSDTLDLTSAGTAVQLDPHPHPQPHPHPRDTVNAPPTRPIPIGRPAPIPDPRHPL